MKLSQPKSAREINTSRVLCEVRKEGSLCKADIARALDLNKVSTGEIVEDLINKGILYESGTVEVENGRRPVMVSIAKDAHYVLCVDIGARNVTVAVCNLLGEVAKMERIPTDVHCTVEEFCVGLLKSCVRTFKLIDQTKLLGIGITVSGQISIDSKVIISSHYLPWKNIAIADVFENNFHVEATVMQSSEALVCAEKRFADKVFLSSKPILYLDWGDHISLAIVKDSRVIVSNTEFGHLRVANTGICVCGEIGCLETVCATWALTHSSEDRLKNLWEKIGQNVLPSMAKALNTAQKITGADKVIVSGEGATIPDEGLKVLQESCEKLTIERSALGEKANITACAEYTLDYFFYHRTMLDEMRAWM